MGLFHLLGNSLTFILFIKEVLWETPVIIDLLLSVVPVVAKVLEKIMATQFGVYLEVTTSTSGCLSLWQIYR